MTVGVVVIGRNEGARLAACLDSVIAQSRRIVYVDSGSVDGSLEAARVRGIATVALDDSRPYTAARARNAGFDALLQRYPGLDMVQFVDGDCLLVTGWIQAAVDCLKRAPGIGVVCGRRRERFPDVSIFNRLCDYEWDTPIGITETCGGDALMRVEAFREAGGFAAELIAGEEPDLCWRLRDAGWTILRIDRDMTFHDAAMMRPEQWWQRNRRSGFAFAEAVARQGRRDRKSLRQVLSNTIWSLPLAWPLWPVLWWRVFRKKDALYATSVMLGKIPHAYGQVDFLKKRKTLIEYK